VNGRRLLVLLAILGIVALPAAALHAACAGRACAQADQEPAPVPFCPLPEPLKEDLENGHYEDRSPDVLGVAASSVWSDTGGTGLRAPWPTLRSNDTRVPIVFAGSGVTPGARIPEGVALDRVAPTVSEAIGLDRPFPKVRSGAPITGVANGERPRLVLLVAWKGVGTAELRSAPAAWPFVASLVRDGAGTLEGETGSLPLDPTATLATIGTGGLPRQHGVTGSFVRGDDGDVVPAFGPGAPVPVIATLADDLDHATHQRSVVSLVATSGLDRGLIGGDWYPTHDADRVVLASGAEAVADARRLLASTGMADDVTDFLGVVLDGGVARLDRRTEQIVRAARAATGGSVLVVVAGTGSADRRTGSVPDADLVQAVEDAVPGPAPVVAAAVPGGIFLDRDTLAAAELTGQAAVDALSSATDPSGGPAMVEAFQGFAVSFARYC
jgi:hypothetical protein